MLTNAARGRTCFCIQASKSQAPTAAGNACETAQAAQLQARQVLRSSTPRPLKRCSPYIAQKPGNARATVPGALSE
jgi:hypothetical protein